MQFAPISAHHPGRGGEKVDERNDFSPFMAKSEFFGNKYLCFVVRSARSVRLVLLCAFSSSLLPLVVCSCCCLMILS